LGIYKYWKPGRVLSNPGMLKKSFQRLHDLATR
jgi:hypothetical protein